MMLRHYPRMASLHGTEALRRHLGELGLELPCVDAGPFPHLAAPVALGDAGGRALVAANRFTVQPMEGWDGTDSGRPTDLVRRRWRNFGASGAGLVWGGEAVAVRPEGRANPHQLMLTAATADDIGDLRADLTAAATEAGHQVPVVGLQLTHSGRWSRPRAGARVAHRHPILDGRVDIADDRAVLTDAEVRELIDDYARAARLAQEQGFDFVDLKHCHGYLLHEFLAARGRAGDFGGPSLQDRTELVRRVVEAVRVAAPRLALGVRLSVFDALPHRPSGIGPTGQLLAGVPEEAPLPYTWGFGVNPTPPHDPDFEEPLALVRQLEGLGIGMINVTAGSPYYVPHVQRPALFPPSDGYAPPEDPLVGVARLLQAARRVKAAAPNLVVVSSGWSYLQDFIPNVAEACLADGWFDMVGLGRMMLSYPRFAADVLAGRSQDRRRVCRTFSDCTTAPRNGMISGCYPLDPFYRERQESATLAALKRGAKS